MPTDYRYTKYFENRHRDVRAHATADELFPNDDCAQAKSVITGWPGYVPTPLHELPDFAASAGVGRVFYKDESSRLGLGAFKALGGAYAVRRWHDEQLASGSPGPFTVATATDGNHGRSVAWGAQLLGIACHIYIHAGVSANRADSLSALGATVHRVAGNYDFSIAECIREADQHRWQIVSDTSWEGYSEIPRQVMAGYTVLADEVVQQLSGAIPSHVILQAGCGGMAGAFIGYFWQHWRDSLPSVVIVESDRSDCVYQSLKTEEIVLVDIVEETVMAGLSCGEVSALAWPAILKGVGHVLTIPDDDVASVMRWLAEPRAARPAIEGGECAASGLIGLLAASRDASVAATIGLDADSSVLVIGTEGATDRARYEQMIAA